AGLRRGVRRPGRGRQDAPGAFRGWRAAALACRARVSPVRPSAPTRIDLAGGTLDIWPLSVLVPGAVTVNLAVELRAHASVEPRKDGRVEVVSTDRKARAVRRLPLTPADCTGPLSLLLRLC